MKHAFRLLLIAFALHPTAHALDFTLNTVADAVDNNVGDGLCDDGAGNCTLRAAIQETNASAGTNTITLPAGTYTLSIPGTGGASPATGDLDIFSTNTLTLRGAGAATTTINGGALDRIFDLDDGSPTNVIIEDLTLTNGLTAASDAGGAIRATADTTLLLRRVVIDSNAAGSGGGGGISVSNGTVTLEDTTFTGNSSASLGGAIDSSSNLTAARVTLSVNMATMGSPGLNSAGTTTLTNTTISGHAGAGLTVAAGTTTTVLNGTITGNLAGVANQGALNLQNTLLAGNDIDCAAAQPITSAGNNLFGDTSCAAGAIASDRADVNPVLGPLQANGGTTQTHALGPGSPAIDAADAGACPASDQRSTARPVDGDGDGDAGCDIGAYEHNPLVFTVDTVLDLRDGNFGDGLCQAVPNLDCSLRAAVQESNTSGGDAALILLPPGTYALTRAGVNETAADTGDLDLNDPVTIRGTGLVPGDVVIDGGALDRVFRIDGVATPGVHLINLTVRNGDASGATFPNGGGIMNAGNGTLTLSDIVLSGNTAQQGAGLYTTNGDTVIDNAAITGNTTNGIFPNLGGGIFVSSGDVDLDASAVTVNTAHTGGAGLFIADTGTAIITDSTLSDNISLLIGGGGGIQSEGTVDAFRTLIAGNTGVGVRIEGSTNTFENVSISGNTGIGIQNNIAGVIDLTNVTITGNGNIGFFSDTPATLITTLISDNTGGDCGASGGVFTNVTSLGNNLYGDFASCNPMAHPFDLFGNALLGPLQDNGGPTLTHALLPGSSAIDSGGVTCPPTDQRGEARPQDGDPLFNPGADCDIGAYEVRTPVDLVITKSDDADPATVGTDITYTVTVTNNGPGEASGVVMTDTLPAGVTFVSATPDQGSCSEAGGTVTCALGTLAASASVQIEIVVTPTALGGLTNNATTSARERELDAADNSVSEITDVEPMPADIAVTKVDVQDPVEPGDDIAWVIEVTNTGPGSASNVTLTDTLPGNVTFVLANPDQGNCNQAAGIVTCNLGTLAANGSTQVSLIATADAEGNVVNNVSVSADESDPVSANNTAAHTTTVEESGGSGGGGGFALDWWVLALLGLPLVSRRAR